MIFFLLLKNPPNVQATLLWDLIYFIKMVTYVDYFRCMYWILTGIIFNDSNNWFLKIMVKKSYTFDYKVGLDAKSLISLIIVQVIFVLNIYI